MFGSFVRDIHSTKDVAGRAAGHNIYVITVVLQIISPFSTFILPYIHYDGRQIYIHLYFSDKE